MIHTLIHKARAEATRTAGTAAIGAVSAILLCVGLAFWTVAGWIVLVSLTSTINAAMIIAAVFTGAALIGFSVVSLRRQEQTISEGKDTQTPPKIDDLLGAFMTGVTAGSRVRS